MTDTELKLALAKMLPEVVEIRDRFKNFAPNDIPLLTERYRLWWGENDIQDDHPVRDTELLHLASLAETKLTRDQQLTDAEALDNLTRDQERVHPFHDKLWRAATATWQQRVTALTENV